MLVHLGVGPDLTQSERRRAKLQTKRQALKAALAKAKAALDQGETAPGKVLADVIRQLELSGYVNAGVGCHLSANATPVLEASFAALKTSDALPLAEGKVCYGSVAGVDYSAGQSTQPSELAAELYHKQLAHYETQSASTRPPL